MKKNLENVKKTVDSIIGKQKRHQKPWPSNQTLQLTDERRALRVKLNKTDIKNLDYTILYKQRQRSYKQKI